MSFITKTFYTTLAFLFIAHRAFSANIAIIESQSFHPMQVMDVKWENYAITAGHSATILPQSTLDNISNLNSYDLLIVTNGLINMPTNRQAVIQQFIALGGDAYLQSEYQILQPGNQTFANTINGLGGTFSWTGESNGNLIPMNVFGDLSTFDSNNISTVDHFWYGAYGEGGQNIIPFLEYGNEHYGFIYCSPDVTHGKVITTSDQDWVRLDFGQELAENIIGFLTLDDNFSVPSIFISVSNDQPCFDEPVTYIANVGTTTADVTYQWVVNSTPVAGATDAAYTAIFNQGDMISCKIDFTKGCSHIEVNSPPLEVVITYPLTNQPILIIDSPILSICDGESITAIATPSDLQGLFDINYQWQLNGEDISSATNTEFTTNTLLDGDVLSCLMNFTTPCNGEEQITSNTFAFEVTPLVIPTLTILSDLTDICAGQQVTFTASGTSLGNNTTYQWQVDGMNVGLNQFTFTSSSLTNAQSVTCIATVNDVTMCLTDPVVSSNEISVNVSDLVTPEVTIQASQTLICEGDEVVFTATGSFLGNNPEFQWQVDGTNVGIDNNTFTSSNLTDGQEITCIVISDVLCSTVSTVTSSPIEMGVNMEFPPSVSIESPQSIACMGTEVTLTATGDNLGNNPQYQWVVNGVGVGENLPTYNTTITNDQIIFCIVSTTNDCIGPLDVQSQELEIILGDVFIEMVDIQQERCESSNGSIEVQPSGGLAPYIYTWDNNNNTNTNHLTGLSAGNYQVTITDANGCTAVGNYPIENLDGAEITELLTNNINCGGLGGTATVIMEDDNADYFYKWKNEAGEILASSKEVQNLQEGLYIVEVIDAFGCSTSEEFYIEPNQPLLVELQDARIKLGDKYEIKLLTNADMSTSQILWNENSSLSCTDCITPTVQPTETTTYFVTVTTADGCSETAHVTIWVEKLKNIFIPNAFSPNNDGMNDHFTIYGGQDVVKVKSIKVVNRWGEIVFSNNNFQVNDESQGWKGSLGNKTLSTGVYVYIAEIEFLDGSVELFKGDVTITQ